MADKTQIQNHIAMTSNVKVTVTPPPKGDQARKQRIMEHLKRSAGK